MGLVHQGNPLGPENKVSQWRPETRPAPEGRMMLKLALVFFVISLVSGFFGFSGASHASARLARILFFIALAIFVISIALALFVGSLVL